ncbi:CRTAC1 family protein [Maribacter algarum]|uniref:CRTAC1 family protein n=1 Tax=Maribacter algarum (ex Zhang et al. 2020) TaxID=2578118 RepID=A0A5S3PMR7_9FLAO|nr:CRTAC1 family protein [Maribacter algarum]TMM55764.1 CRTAC1 family protein [Maribacter algarum]
MNLKTPILKVLCFCLLVFISVTSSAQIQKEASVQFDEVFKEFPRKEKDLRKWDSPVVADLDQDGYPDLILNDHGLGINISWNNKGKFAKPYDLIMGDIHGVSVGDFDKDGNLELILSRGGGSGANARNSKMYRVGKNREFTALPDFDVPLEMMRGRTVKFFDGNNNGHLDLINFAFPSKEKKGKSENYIYENNGNGQLVLNGTIPSIKKDGQKTLLTDFNNDHIADIVLFGDGPIKAYQGDGKLNFTEVTNTILSKEINHATAIAELDFDNDGDMDLYIARGKEFEIGETFYNKTTKTWGFFSRRGKSEFKDILVGDVLQMHNFQSQWPFNDAYYIGESAYTYEFPGETHSGKNIRLVNSNALGFPDNLNEDGGIHVGYVGNEKWRIAVDTWSPTTGTVKGVLDYPKYEHPAGLSDILLENKNGTYINVSTKMGFIEKEHTVGVSIADMDNNGYPDILVVKRGNLVFENEALLYLNQNGKTFSKAQNHGITTADMGAVGMALEVLDYDLDGDMDAILGNERGKWHLFQNNTPENKSVTITIDHSPSKKATALGAVVTVKGCTGKQTKRIGSSGSQYSLSFDTNVHFGLGACSKAVTVEVRWTNGETKKMKITNGKTTINIGS